MNKSGSKKGSNLCFLIILVTVMGIVILIELLFIDNQIRTSERKVNSYAYKYSVHVNEDSDENNGDRLDDTFDFIDSRNGSIVTSTLDGYWQRVRNTRYRFYVYSAFLDYRSSRDPLVRIIATTRTSKPDKVLCLLSNNLTNKTMVTEAKLKLIRENWRLKYSAYFVLCPLRSNLKFVPDSVAVKYAANDTVSNLLSVIDNRKFRNNKQNLAVCIKPIHYNFNNFTRILEFIELNRILNVNHFTFYDHTIGDQVKCILREYEKDNITSILSWNLKFISQKEIRTENQFAAFNDCLYRSMYRFDYVIFIDLDEFIIPKSKKTLTDLIEFLNEKIKLPRKIGAYSFQNAFFYLQWPDDNHNTVSSPMDTLTLRKTRRKEKLNPHKQRSKYICRPEMVVEAGNHFVWEFLKNEPIKVFEVPPKLAMSHHYRICEFGGNDCIDKASLIDRTAWHFKTELVQAIEKRYAQFQSTCKLPVIF